MKVGNILVDYKLPQSIKLLSTSMSISPVHQVCICVHNCWIVEEGNEMLNVIVKQIEMFNNDFTTITD